MSDQPQMQRRQIGRLNIIDVKGELVGPWALRVKEELNALISHHPNRAVVINLKSLQGIDSLGVKALIESLPGNQPAGLLSGNLSVMEMIKTVALPSQVRILKGEEDLVDCFGRELVESDTTGEELRKHWRMNTALPLKFSCEGSKGESYEFRAIVTNLSEGGLFAEYIDLTDAIKSQSFVNPYELKMLVIEVKLPTQQNVIAKGKVIRRKLNGEQVGIGIEFYEISPENKRMIQDFLKYNAASLK